MREYHKALAIVGVCSLIVAGGLLRAYLVARSPITSAEVLAATRRAVDEAVEAAIRGGGLKDGEEFVRSSIDAYLRHSAFEIPAVRLRRPNDLNPYAAFYFLVEIPGLTVRFALEGTREPLYAIRTGGVSMIRQDPSGPYESHRDIHVMEACVAQRYYHHAPEAPDFFARLENRTSDPYHFGFEAILTNGRALAADYVLFETGRWGLEDLHRQRYGISDGR